jgi:hypothetical protein
MFGEGQVQKTVSVSILVLVALFAGYLLRRHAALMDPIIVLRNK